MSFSRIFDLPKYQLNKYHNKECICNVDTSAEGKESTEEACRIIDRLSLHWLTMGIEKGTFIGMVCSGGSREWLYADMSLMQAGAVIVSIHPAYNDKELSLILKETDLKICIVETPELAKRIKKLHQNIETITLSELPIKNERLTKEEEELINTRKESISETDLATIIYTSGSTGLPKGVMLSHYNIMSNIKASITLIPVNYKHRTASFLPISHVFERTIIYTYIAVGASIYFVKNRQNLVWSIRKIKPHFITCVPRILENIHEYINQHLEELSFVQKFIVKWSLKQGKKENKKLSPGKVLNFIKWFIADILVYRKWRKVMGGKLIGIGVGAAALHPELGRLFSKAGIRIREGYGLTETSPVVSFNRFEPGGVVYGTAGIVIPGVEVKILSEEGAEEGEILVKGPNVMMGYYDNEALTKKVIDADGWFHTGDIGKFVKARFLKITDRKKDIFKTSSGKYVAPQKLENILRNVKMISQTMILGFQRSFVAALIIPDFKILESWCKANNVHWTAPQYMVHNTAVEKKFQLIIDEINETLKSHERVRKFSLLHKEWSVASGEYTPSLKLRRDSIKEKYKEDIQKLYEQA